MRKADPPSHIVLRGGWGGDASTAIMTHDCVFEGAKRGRHFCNYLVHSTSWEFGSYNVERLAYCVRPGAARRKLLESAESQDGVTVETPYSPALGREIHLAIDYAPPSGMQGLYTLTIRISPDDDEPSTMR